MNEDSSISARETLSALADGQLGGEAFARAVSSSAADPDALATWHCYHLIGDVLRSGEIRADAGRDQAFLAGLRLRLAQEKVPLRLSNMPETEVAVPVADRLSVRAVPVDRSQAANDGVWRWKALAGVASVAAIGALTWNLAGSAGSGSGSGAVLARTVPDIESTPVLVASPQGAILRDARLDELLDAHRQVGGNSALQMPAGFLRNATFEGRPR